MGSVLRSHVNLCSLLLEKFALTEMNDQILFDFCSIFVYMMRDPITFF